MSIDLLQLSKDLVAIQSVSHMSNAAACGHLTHVLAGAGFEIEELIYTDPAGVPKVNLVAKRGQGSGGLAFSSHIDTVPGQEEDWPAFAPLEKDGRLYGRGSCDMKGPLAATIVAAASVDRAALQKPVYILVSADEEVGCLGAKYIAENSVILKESRPDYGIVAEPTQLIPVYAHKGFSSLTITAQGKAAHTSTGLGVSANFKIARFLAEMADLADLFETDQSFMNHEFKPPTNGFNMTIDDGGCKTNVTAPRSTCQISYRPMPGARSEEVLDMVKAKAERHGLEFSGDYTDAFYMSPQAAIVQLAGRLSEGREPETAPYGTDGFYLKDLMELVVWGPGDIAVAHTVGESVAVAELEQAVRVYTEAIKQVCM